jgi:pimeloyl-ACP methyl ester carboxylesterase
VSDDLAPGPEAIEHLLPWEQTIRGVRWGHGRDRILMIHEPGADLDAWLSLPLALAQVLHVAVLAFDLPGHGLSDDPWDPERLREVLRSLSERQAPVGHLMIVAAGTSADAALDVAAEKNFGGLVCLSPAQPGEARARSPQVPKLFIAGSLASDDLDRARGLAASGGWTLVTTVPVASRGTGLLDTNWSGQIAEQITGFLRDCLLPQTRYGRRRIST